ncbi:MAG: efflux RND transporter permease subunit [bacterium]|nr:efflux RND transporter permease subunit [bacterium]
MFLTNLSIKKSLTVFVLIFVLLVTGFHSYISLPREAAPEITIPYIIVNTFYFGVSPADMETLVTNPIEKKLKSLKDIKEMTSSSGDSFSSIAIEFDINIDINEALRKVKEKVDLAKADLPEDSEEPQVIEINLSDIPVMVINISGKYSLHNLKHIAENLKDRIEMVKGVLDITISGGLEREIQVIVDKNLLKKYELSLNQISRAVSAENINIPGGTINIGNSKYLVRIPGEVKKIKELENIVIKTPDKTPVYLKDVAQVKDSFKEKETYSRMNQIESVSLSIQKRSGENIIRISQDIKKLLEAEKPGLPHTTEINIIADQSEDISDMVDELENSIVLGLILVTIVLLAFMGLRNAFFVATAIPFSMLITFIVLKVLGITLNMVLLFSLILALGMLVDNAIVIVENIYRFIEEGYSKREAAKKATAEVALAVSTSTATTVAVFIPLLYIPGVAGKFMRFLPIGAITTISSSLFVALIINPVLCANFMTLDKKRHKKNKSSLHNKVNRFYRIILQWSLKNRAKTILATIAALFISIFLFYITSPGQEFFPDITPSRIYIDISTPEDSTLKITNQIVMKIENYLIKEPNIINVISTVGSTGSNWLFGSSSSPDKARIIVEFPDKEQRLEHPKKTISKIRQFIKNIPGAEIDITKEDMGPPGGAPVSIQISGPEFSKLEKYTSRIKNIMTKVEGITDIKDNFNKGRPEIRVEIDRDKAALSGLSTYLIASTIRTAIHGTKISVFRDGNDEYDIILKFPEDLQNNINSIEELNITSPDGIAVPLPELATIKTTGGLGTIQHSNQNRVITIEANAKNGYLPHALIKILKQEASRLTLEDGYSLKFTGENEDMQVVANYLNKAFIIALFLIALIMVTHFDSIFLPLIILFSVFLSLIGIILGLVIFQRPFGVIMTGIGAISLAGVVVNNAIVLIDYFVQLQKRGFNRISAVIKAGSVRLRPVILTAVTTILGLVPMTFGINFNFKMFYNNLFSKNIVNNFFSAIEIGSQSTEFWGSMGSAVTIGLATGTILTLIVVPVLYISIDNLANRVKRKLKTM